MTIHLNNFTIDVSVCYDVLRTFREPPTSNQEWLKLLDHQRLLHESEISQWKEILSTSIQLLDQMTHTLAELRSSLDEQPAHKRDKTYDGTIPS